MKIKKFYLSLIIIALSIGSGCSRVETNDLPSAEEVQEKSEIESSSDTSREMIELTLWSHHGGWELYTDGFQEKNPNINIKTELIPFDEYTNALIDALVEGNPPDIIILDDFHLSTLKGLEGLQDLYQSPFNAAAYKDSFEEGLWRAGESPDLKQMIALPFNISPKVTYYRADIMEDYGFPSEPDALAAFMEDPDNWVKIARELKKDNKWITQWPYDPVEIFDAQTRLFDEEFNFLKDSKDFHQAIDIAKTIYQENLSPYVSIWDDRGQEAIKEDRIAMIYLGSWGAETIQAWVPEQAGKWRATKLPFGVEGWSNVSFISIAEASKNKETAWKFLEYFVFQALGETMTGAVTAYVPQRNHSNTINHKNEFLGGQKDQAFYQSIYKEKKQYILTPLDNDAYTIWIEGVYRGLDWGMAPKEIIESIMRQLEVELGGDRDILIESLQ